MRGREREKRREDDLYKGDKREREGERRITMSAALKILTDRAPARYSRAAGREEDEEMVEVMRSRLYVSVQRRGLCEVWDFF